MLAFQCKRQEQAWSLHFARDNAGLDAAISLQTVFFPSLVARMVSCRGGQPRSGTRGDVGVSVAAAAAAAAGRRGD